MREPIAPLHHALAWEEAVESLLVRAAAQGRRDGLQQMESLESASPAPAAKPGSFLLPPELQPVLQIALRHCYLAGHLHGAEVRRENDRRVARHEPPLGTLMG